MDNVKAMATSSFAVDVTSSWNVLWDTRASPSLKVTWSRTWSTIILDDFYFGKKTLLSRFYSPSDLRDLGFEYRHVYDLAFGEIQLSLQLVYQFLL
jgi:hypothetical protein